MKTVFALGVFLLLTATHFSYASVAAISPTGNYSATIEISGAEAGPSRHDCLKLILTDTKTGKEYIYQTGASNFQKWASAWSTSDILVIYSADIGTFSFSIEDEKIIERPATEDEKIIGTRAYDAKYTSRTRR